MTRSPQAAGFFIWYTYEIEYRNSEVWKDA